MATISPDEARQRAWATHEAAERLFDGLGNISDSEGTAKLLAARRQAAERFPGCAIAILNPDTARNWDRGSIIRQLIDQPPE